MTAITQDLPRAIAENLPQPLQRYAETVLNAIEAGRFQRSMCLLVASTSIVSGAEVSYEHYRGSYSNPVMYSPVALSGVLTIAGFAGFFSDRLARTFLRWTSVITLADGIIGFGFHVRGIARKPGGWRIPIVNIVMGPPILAPILFGTSAYLGILASYLQREDGSGGEALSIRRGSDWRSDLHRGRFQKHLSAVTIVWTLCSGFEAWYSHYKSNFRFRVQWSPIVVTPILVGACIGAIFNRRIARTALPLAAGLAMADGAAGFFYHVRGIAKRPGGLKKPLYNTLYGPPIFAPMLFAACGMLGLLASLLRRERR